MSPTPTNKFQRYRENQRQRGLKMLRLWVPDPKATTFGDAGRGPPPGELLLKRGDIITAELRGGGKPRRMVVVQTDGLPGGENVLACPLQRAGPLGAPAYRLRVASAPAIGLEADMEIAADKLRAVPRELCISVHGRLDPADMTALDRILALVLGLAD